MSCFSSNRFNLLIIYWHLKWEQFVYILYANRVLDCSWWCFFIRETTIGWVRGIIIDIALYCLFYMEMIFKPFSPIPSSTFWSNPCGTECSCTQLAHFSEHSPQHTTQAQFDKMGMFYFVWLEASTDRQNLLKIMTTQWRTNFSENHFQSTCASAFPVFNASANNTFTKLHFSCIVAEFPV